VRWLADSKRRLEQRRAQKRGRSRLWRHAAPPAGALLLAP
jgi:hypothetical protein